MSSITPIPIISGELSPMPQLVAELSIDLNRDKYYDGNYDISPRVGSQTIPTADKILREDITIDPIPYSEVPNEAGGLTVNIAYEE